MRRLAASICHRDIGVVFYAEFEHFVVIYVADLIAVGNKHIVFTGISDIFYAAVKGVHLILKNARFGSAERRQEREPLSLA